MLHREIFQQGFRFDIRHRLYGDYDLLLHILIKEKKSYLHMEKIGVIYQSVGFSSNNNNIRKFSSEFKEIQKKYFKNIYFLFKFIHLLTFPKFRQFIKNYV
jgi:hypothetical protein